MAHRGMMRFLMVLMGLLALIVAGCRGKPAAAEVGPRPGAMAPAFTTSLLNGQEVALADLRGKPVILNFWATWCGPCRHEMPRLEAVSAGTNADISIRAVNYGETEDAVSAYVHDTGVTLPIALDPDLALARTYLIFGMPTTFFIDAQGVVQMVHTGELTDDLLDQFVGMIRGK